ncbi:heat-inducible transcriptional repressor HrcA [Natronospira bacteriovora]|uniref:Heat-inducible transcription repressor HrcA n=1 Tax=Natronospira bacteriovora TaxID=3069753 RepID=A0ABU0W519_9GAMM|nr:heat-inducible transcriptional repressor HrcA [Natronospira sp. AB-CW4]MDQ2069114.1 heat-inducible transcriptional repressor HrcA [Natronospira sp. AB-CW4]
MITVNRSDNPLNDRAQYLLKTLVERYIREGHPVGSRALSRQSGLELSPASIRNVMADLEELGFVQSPHTSAGRVPTVKGYRFFVDTLLTVKKLNRREVSRLELGLRNDEGDFQALLGSASTLLSGVTRLAGVVTLPRRERATWKQIEFLPLSDRRVLAVVVFSDQDVQNRVLRLERGYDREQLHKAANYLNAHFAGKDLTQVREALLAEMREARQSMNELMLTAIQMADQVFDSDRNVESGYVIAGETNLMEFDELSDVEKLRRLFEAFNQKRDILHLLDKAVAAEGVQIFIGEESGYKVLDECSVVTAPYSADDEVVGVLGVIGPTRMAYERVIPIVDMTARLLGHALNSRQ